MTKTTLPNGTVFDYTLDGAGNVTQVFDETLNGTTQFTYDAKFNQITSITDPHNKTSTLNYDQFGNLVQVSSPLNRTSHSRYDSRGLPTAITDTLGTLTTLTYNAQGNPQQSTQGTGSEARTTDVTYTNEGYVETVTDPASRLFSFSYDALGRVKTSTSPDSRVTSFDYDTNGNTSITPPGRPAHTFVLNTVDLVTAFIPPDVGEVSQQTDFSYNKAQELTQVDLPDGKFIQYGYDYGGRLGAITTTQGVYGYDYDLTTGNLKSVTAPDGGQVGYDYHNYLITKNTWNGAVAGSVERTYDASGRVDSLGVNGADVVGFQFNDDGQLIQAGTLNLSYDAQSGLLDGTDVGLATDALEYNQFGEALTYTMQYNSSDLYAELYRYDDLGRIITKTETVSGVTMTYGYTYDLAGRLSQVKRNGALIAHYGYDTNGNRVAFTDTVTTIAGTYDDQDRLLQYGTTTYSYTANGELTHKVDGGQMTAYQYDEFSNLRSVTLPDSTLIEYIIDANDRRIGRKVNGSLVQSFLYQDGLNPIAELDGAGVVVSRFVYASQANVPDYMVKGGNTYRIVTDHLGSVRLVVDMGTGQVTQRLDYDAFGNVLTDTNEGFQPFGFAGGLYDVATGLVRFGARDYDAEVGRWTTKDPIGFDGGDMNLYGYVESA